MPHGMSWFSFLPGYAALEAYAAHNGGKSLLQHNAVGVQHVIAAAFVLLFMLFASWRSRAALAASGDAGLVPAPKLSFLNFFEVVADMIYGRLKAMCGVEGRRFFPVIAPLSMFVLFSNLLGLIPGFSPPTDNLNTTFACGVFVFLYYHFHGLRVNGFAHIAHLANPAGTWWGWFMAPLMLPIELVSHCARPVSLSIRLMANMMGDHIVMGIFVSIFPFVLPLPFFALGLLVCVVQTIVFTLLAMVYLSLAVAHADHGDDHHAQDHGHAQAHA